MSIKLDKLPKDAASLKEIIVSQQHKIDHLEEMNRLFQNELFGRKTEVRPSEPSPNQLPLFDLPELEEPVEEKKEVTVKGHSRKKRGRKPLPKDLPRIKIYHDIPEEEKICACGETLKCIGTEECEKLDFIPAKMRVEVHIRPKYACKACEGVEDGGPTVKTAPPPVQLLPKSFATAGLLAYIIVSKFADALPLYRLQKIFLRMKIDLSRATMADWLIKVAELCSPIMELLKEQIRSGPLINIDETPLQVLKEFGRSNKTKSYMWVFLGGLATARAVLFQYHPTRSGKEALKDVLGGYQGYVQSDGYAGYDFLSDKKDISLMGCWAHARRKFMNVVKAKKSKKNNKSLHKGLADDALDFIGKMYKIEKDARKIGLDENEIYELRQEKSKPILKEFKKWLNDNCPSIPPKSLIGKAFRYTLNQWDKLEKYVEAGFLRSDNNLAENAIRPFVVGRKNWLFSGSPKGAEASATFFSLIETAKANGLEPYAYLRYLLDKLPYAESRDDYLALLPGHFDEGVLDYSADEDSV